MKNSKRYLRKNLISFLMLVVFITTMIPPVNVNAANSEKSVVMQKYKYSYVGSSNTYTISNVKKGYTIKWSISKALKDYVTFSKDKFIYSKSVEVNDTTSKIKVYTLKSATDKINTKYKVTAVIYDNKGKKVATCSDEVKINVDATDIIVNNHPKNHEMSVNTSYDFNRTLKPKKSVNKTFWIVTDENDNVIVDSKSQIKSDKVVMKANGIFTPKAIGTYKIYAVVYRSDKATVQRAKSMAVEIHVIDPSDQIITPIITVTPTPTVTPTVTPSDGGTSNPTPKTYNLDIETTSNGVVDVNSKGSYQAGAKVKVKVLPNQYYKVEGWSSNAGGSFVDATANETVFTMPSNNVSIKVNLVLQFNENGDEDGDGLANNMEVLLGTDLYKPDSDKDGLTDYYEYYLTQTDPLKADTDDDGVSDGDEDLDNDELTNKEEFVLKTNPLDIDTDGDGLKDNYEIKLYHTNPILEDTDNDGLTDSKELELGTDPTNPDTDGDGILDGDEIFIITKSTSQEETDPNAVPTITMNIPGKMIDTLSIQKIAGDNFYLPEDMPGYIGAGYEFKLDGTFDSALLSFSFINSLLQDPNFQPAIYYCDEINQEMVLLDNQTVDLLNGTVSVTITHFSKYILLNKRVFEDVWDSEIKPPSQTNEPAKSIAIAMSLDSSGSMEWNDSYDIRKDAAKLFVDQLGENDEAAIIDFDDDAILLAGMTSDKDVLYDAIDNVDSSGGTDISAGLSLALDQVEAVTGSALYVVLLTDGEGYYDYSLTQRAIDLGVVVYTIGLGSSVDTALLQSIASQTGGRYYHASVASDLTAIFEKAAGETIDYEKDSDGDGLTDYYEKLIASGKVMAFNGKKFLVDYLNPDSDGDGLEDGREINVKSSIFGYVCLNVNSYPDNVDTDYDGISDGTIDYDGTVVVRDLNPTSNDFTGIMTANGFTFDVEFNVNYRLLFGVETNKSYNDDLAILGSIFATKAYHDPTLSITKGAMFVNNVFNTYGLKDYENYKLADYFNDDDISEMEIGHRNVTYNGVSKEVIIVAVRGTDATIEEWSSNFDVGADTISYWDRNNKFWRDKDNHKGFDVAANRLYDEIERYVNSHNLTSPKTIFIVGHSRGAAIANILGSKFEDNRDYQSYTYTFASPNTTTDTGSYSTIFNIVNKDDLVPYLPLDTWGFSKYGNTYTVSIKDEYENIWFGAQEGTWENFFGVKDYNYNGNLNDTLSKFRSIATSREELYNFIDNDKSYYTFERKYNTFSEAQNAAKIQFEKYGERIGKFCEMYILETDPLLGKTTYQVSAKQNPAAFMMILTDIVASKCHKKVNGFDQTTNYSSLGKGEQNLFGNDLGFFVAPLYKKAKDSFIQSGADSKEIGAYWRVGGMVHSHMPGSYYFIVSDFKNLIPTK